MSWEPGKPSQNENEWFIRRDAEWLKAQRAKIEARRAAHPSGINCPRDGSELDERVFDGVRVDTCPTCHGIWLDAGELEQVIHLRPATLRALVATVGVLPDVR